ncbi:ParA family protein [Streptomyces sp. MBT27]|uniref:ParA family protein n=1 Tax=Streptomyces sp. MBT27 TaxID=1488356 RepID=UPI0014222B53|nr:ParA family protein [Streptomyces sp. MBT27]
MSLKSLPRRNTRPNGRNWPLLLAALIISGGSAKTSTIAMLAVILALRGVKVRVFDFDHQRSLSHIFCAKDELKANQATIYELAHNEATLEQASVPARYKVAEGEYLEIDNLTIVPGSKDVKNFDTECTERGNEQLILWFKQECEVYQGDDEVWLLDLPASLSKFVVSGLIPFQEDDEILPPVLVTDKEATDLKTTFEELAEMCDQQRTRTWQPRPTIKHIAMCGTPTPSYPDGEGDQTVADMTKLYGNDFTLHKVRWNKPIRQQHRRQAPVHAFGAKNSAAIEDYNKIVTALGFPDIGD